MANKSKKPQKKKPEEEPQERNMPSEPEGESEEGPLERERQFLAERLAPLQPKGKKPDKESTPPPTTLLPEPPAAPPEGTNDAAEARRRALEEFRRRQKSEGDKPEKPPNAPPGNAFGLEAPQAPAPPPSNNWIPIGPSVLRQGQGGVKPATSGRTPAIAVAPGGTRIYIGSANGGVWRSDDSGVTWHSLMNAFDLNPATPASDSLSVGAIAMDPANPDRVYVGSGEGDGAAYFGVGPIVTNNGTADPYGATPPAWTTEPVAPGSASLSGTAFYALAVDPVNPDRVVAATYRGIYRREPNGMGGFHWSQKILGGSAFLKITSVVAAVSAGTTTFYAAPQNGPVYSSTDGHTWNPVGTGFPAGMMRISLAVRPDNPNVIYALVQNGNVYRLDIADGTWRQITGVPAGFTGNQGWYDLAIAVAPDNVNRIYLGGSTVLSDGISIVAGGTPGSDWSGALFRCEVTVSGTTVSMTPAYIGGSVHADIHTIVFAPGDASKLWVGCDGGVFYSTNPTGTGSIFKSCNTGLQTLTMQHIGQHPTEDAVLFVGTQDNGGERFTGEEAWLYSSGGDAGFAIVNWQDPYSVLSSYIYGSIRRSVTGGTRYSYFNVNVPLPAAEAVLFYAPIAGTPPNPMSATAVADANLVAFGSIRPWISTDFGTTWQSIPNNTLAGDSLVGPIRSLAFASPNRFYAGTYVGWVFVNGSWVQYTDAAVYRFDRTAAGWTRTRIDTMGGANSLPLDGSVTDIAVDPANADGIYITFGGTGDYRHVWYFDGTQWQQRSGPAAGNVNSLIDVQVNAIVVDPANPADLYIGADIGVWRSTDSGANWAPFSEGLPDAAVMDLALHSSRRLLRASTHGRSAWERTLPDTAKEGIELYIRDTQLDQGRFTTVNGLPDPTAVGQGVYHWAGPDIKLDTPDVMGQYQFPLTGTIDFHQFVDVLSDDAHNVATHATATIMTRVYVQVHNRGVTPANGVRVMLLLANASTALPALPAGYWVNVQTGVPINTANWHTVGIFTLNDVRVGAPKIAAFDLPSSMLPPPANLAGNNHHCVLALVHHPNDQYTSTITNTDMNSLVERKAAHKNLTVVQFTGTLPPPMPVMIPFRIHNAELEQEIETAVGFNLGTFSAIARGAARLYSPPLKTSRPLEEALHGMKIDDDHEPFKQWAEEHIRMIRENLGSGRPYDKEWSMQRMEDIERVLQSGLMFRFEEGRWDALLDSLLMEPDSYHTFFLALDRPQESQLGDQHRIDIMQLGKDQGTTLGGLRVQVQLTEEPEISKYRLEFWRQKWMFGYTVFRARLYDPADHLLTPQTGATVQLMILEGNRWFEVQMPWHLSWNSFYYFSRGLQISQLMATGFHNGAKVVEVQFGAPAVQSLLETPEGQLKAE